MSVYFKTLMEVRCRDCDGLGHTGPERRPCTVCATDGYTLQESVLPIADLERIVELKVEDVLKRKART